jgi:hypothetical protein
VISWPGERSATGGRRPGGSASGPSAFVKIPPKYGSRRMIDIAPLLKDLLSGHLAATGDRERSCERSSNKTACEGSGHVFLGSASPHYPRRRSRRPHLYAGASSARLHRRRPLRQDPRHDRARRLHHPAAFYDLRKLRGKGRADICSLSGGKRTSIPTRAGPEQSPQLARGEPGEAVTVASRAALTGNSHDRFRSHFGVRAFEKWSGRRDLNPRPLDPQECIHVILACAPVRFRRSRHADASRAKLSDGLTSCHGSHTIPRPWQWIKTSASAT